MGHGGTPKSLKSLDHVNIETNGDLGIYHFKQQLYVELDVGTQH